jgi:phosphatidylglycerophosphate synthase
VFCPARYNPGRVDSTLSGLYIAKVGGLFAVMMAIAIARLRAHHPFARFGAANQITTVRALLVALVAGFIGEPHTAGAATVAAATSGVATLLDGLDGWLARRAQMTSGFGARFDMEVDALLIQVLALLTWQWGKAGPWVLASGMLRYVFVAAGWLLPWMRRPLTPTLRARAICVVQIATLVLAIVPAITPPASPLVAAVGLVALCYSFFVDTVWLWRRRA